MSIQPLAAAQVSRMEPEALLACYREHIVEQHRESISGVSPNGDAAHIQSNLVLLEKELISKLKLAQVA